MINGRKINSKYTLALLFTALFFSITSNISANDAIAREFYKTLTTLQDTVKPVAVDTLFQDSAAQRVDTFNVKVSKDSLDAPISYAAADSVVMDIPTKKITLYNKGTVKYQAVNLEAYKIQLDQSKQLLIASYSTDTSGAMIGKPKMVETTNTMESDTIVYSLKSQKGITQNTFTQSGDMYVHADKMKKISPSEYFASRGRLTTCNYDPPHFAFIANKMKLINKKFAITGPVHPEFEGVPVPIYIPFGFFPLDAGPSLGASSSCVQRKPSIRFRAGGLGVL